MLYLRRQWNAKKYAVNLWISTTVAGSKSDMLTIVLQYNVCFMHKKYREQTRNFSGLMKLNQTIDCQSKCEGNVENDNVILVYTNELAP